MKNKYQYQVTLNSIADNQQIDLEISSHDDILDKLSLIDGKLSIPAEDEKAFLIGLKMAGEIILKHRDHELFSTLKAPMKEIMSAFKGYVK